MPRKTTRAHKRAEVEEKIQRPTVLALVTHILGALISDGMAWLTIPVIAATAFLYQNHFRNDIMLAVVFASLVIIALVRGSRDWQRDLNDYQRQIAMERHRSQVGQQPVRKIPGFFPSQPRR